MLTRAIGDAVSRTRDDLARALIRLGVAPNMLTLSGLGVTAAAGWMIARGRFAIAILLIVVSGACDMLDGAVAKLGGKATPLGGFLDSCLDRYSDIVLFGGVYFYFRWAGESRMAILTLVALVGALLTSYARARAECVIDRCQVGYWERGERVVGLMVALAIGHVSTVVWILAVFTHWTVVQRIVYTARVLSGGAERRLPFALRLLQWDFPRRSYPYDVATWVFLLTLLLVALPS